MFIGGMGPTNCLYFTMLKTTQQLLPTTCLYLNKTAHFPPGGFQWTFSLVIGTCDTNFCSLLKVVIHVRETRTSDSDETMKIVRESQNRT